MTDRITFQMQTSTLLAGLTQDLQALDQTQQELTTGRKINQPSDDPVGEDLALRLSSQLAALSGYSSSVSDATGWANTAGSSLQTVLQMMQNARSMIVQASNGAVSQSSLSSMSATMTQLVTAIKQTANVQYNGSYVFSGTATQTAPYLTGTGQSDTFQGNTAAINRSIGPGMTLAVNFNLSSVLGNGHAAHDGGLLDTLETAAQDMASGNTGNLGSDLAALDANLTSMNDLQANVAAVQSRLQLASSRLAGLQLVDQGQLSDTTNVDIAQASIKLATEQASYNAALQSGSQIIQTSLLNFLHA